MNLKINNQKNHHYCLFVLTLVARPSFFMGNQKTPTFAQNFFLMRFFCIILICFAIGSTACNNPTTLVKVNTDSLKAAAKAARVPASNMSKEGTVLMMSVVEKYYGLKNALVATKADSAKRTAVNLLAMTGILKHYLESDTAFGKGLMPYVDTIINEANQIPAIEDEHCEKQRIHFEHISSAIYGMAKKSGLKNAGIYHEFCPMAFHDKGAFWLSDDNEIRNPYFGSKMLECGEVTDSL